MEVAVMECINQLKSLVQPVAQLKDRIFHIYSEEELLDKTKGLQFPCIGLVYSGMVAAQEPVKDTHRVGVSAELSVTVMVFFRQDTKATVDPKTTNLALIDQIRSAIMGKKSPTGHFWRFQMEGQAVGASGMLVYVQRWYTPVQLT